MNQIALNKMKEENIFCWECKGKPEFIYFNDETLKVLSVICKSCRDIFESAIKSIGKRYCTDQNCEKCNEETA